jgi:hypothetical protein
MCHAYAAFAVERPVQYRLMMSVQGKVHADWDPTKLPGAPVLAMMRDALAAAALDPRAALPSDATVVQLWATLHGILALRASRPTFPWPPLAQMIDDAVDSAMAAVR